VDKGIGFVRTVTLDWLDLTAFLCLQQVDPEEMKVAKKQFQKQSTGLKLAEKRSMSFLPFG